MYPSMRYSFLNQQPKQDIFGYPYSNINFDKPAETYGGNLPATQVPEKKKTFADFYREAGNRDTPALSAYQQFLEKGYPQEMPPSKMTRLGAILAGAAVGFRDPSAGVQTSQSILDRPYERAVRQYGMEGQKLKESAGIEEQVLNNKARLAKDFSDSQRADDEFDLKVKNTQSEIKSRDLNMQKTILEMANIGLKTETDKNTGILYAVNTINGSKQPIGKFDLNTGERINEKVNEAVGVERGTSPIKQDRELAVQGANNFFQYGQQNRLFGQQKELQNNTFKQQDKTQAVTQAGADRRSAATHANQSQTSLDRRNTNAVIARIQSDPNKFKDVYIDEATAADTKTIPYELKPPPLPRGKAFGEKEPTSEDIKKYNAFVELYNLKNEGNTQVKKLSPVGETPEQRFKRLSGGK